MLYKEILQRQWPRKLTYCVKKNRLKKKSRLTVLYKEISHDCLLVYLLFFLFL